MNAGVQSSNLPFQPRLYCPNQRPLVDFGRDAPRTNLATDAVAVNGSSVVKALMSSVAHSGLALGPLLTKKASPAFGPPRDEHGEMTILG